MKQFDFNSTIDMLNELYQSSERPAGDFSACQISADDKANLVEWISGIVEGRIDVNSEWSICDCYTVCASLNSLGELVFDVLSVCADTEIDNVVLHINPQNSKETAEHTPAVEDAAGRIIHVIDSWESQRK